MQIVICARDGLGSNTNIRVCDGCEATHLRKHIAGVIMYENQTKRIGNSSSGRAVALVYQVIIVSIAVVGQLPPTSQAVFANARRNSDLGGISARKQEDSL